MSLDFIYCILKRLKNRMTEIRLRPIAWINTLETETIKTFVK